MSTRARSKERRPHRLRLLAEYPFCFWCERPLDHDNATLDHIVPTAHGGRNGTTNYVLACPECNNARGAPEITAEEAERILREWDARKHAGRCTLAPKLIDARRDHFAAGYSLSIPASLAAKE